MKFAFFDAKPYDKPSFEKFGVENGIEFNGIDVYPFSMLNDIKQNYSAVICDFGFLRECHKPYYGDCNVKIMLCSAAEWDIGLTMKYINFSNESHIHDINFCFPRVTRTKFIKYNKQFIRSGCNAYKLNYSPDWTCPHQDNFTVYKKGKTVTNPQTGMKIELPGTKVGTVSILQSIGDTPETEISFCSYDGEELDVNSLENYYISDK